MEVALYNGNVVLGDATGNALLAKRSALASAGVPTRLYTHHSAIDASDITVVRDVDQVRRDPFRQNAGVHVFEFGWTYELFDLVREVTPPARAIVTFHGITPRALLPDHLQGGFDLSVAQLEYAKRADVVLCASAYARTVLTGRGFEAARIHILPLPIRLPRTPRQASARSELYLLFVGRLMPSKGLLDLLHALAALRDEGRILWRLSVVTNEMASDPAYTERVRRYIDEVQLGAHIEHFGKIENRAELAARYAAADVVIIPTYHETYCLPLLEAFANGCAVIAYASGAVPETASGLARLVPTGDVRALTDELRLLFAAAGRPEVGIANGESIPRTEFERRSHLRTRDLAGETYDRRFLQIVDDRLELRQRSWLGRQLRRPFTPGS
jgi:glycosyltransferase involved in cell wall biosynthesis